MPVLYLSGAIGEHPGGNSQPGRGDRRVPATRRAGNSAGSYRRADAIDGLVSPGYVNHAASTEEYRRGGAKRAVEWLLSVFPDHRFEVVAADGETVAVRGTMTGTHEGELLGIAPTGERVAAQQSHWFRVSEGKLTEHWAVRDDLGMIRQLGVMPP